MSDGKKQKRTYMLCEVPSELEQLGVKADTARALNERFASLRLTEKTRAAIKHAASYSRERGGYGDEFVLHEILVDIIGEPAAQTETDRLLGKYGSLIGLLDAIGRVDYGVGLTPGVKMRIELLAAIYLSENCAVRVLTRAYAELLCTERCDDDTTYAIALDGNFTVADIVDLGAEILPENTFGAVAKNGVKYVILMRKTPTVTDEYYDLVSKMRDLARSLDARGITLIDFLIFTSQGAAAIDPATVGDNPSFEFLPIARALAF